MKINIEKSRKWIDEFLINIILFFMGVVLILVGVVVSNESFATILLSIGTSIIASVIVGTLSLKYLYEQEQLQRMLKKWGIEKIYERRSEINDETNEILLNAMFLDVSAMGLKGFRDAQGDIIEKRVKNGMKLRILTIDPDNKYLKEIDKKEHVVNGFTKETIQSLLDWVEKIKEKQLYTGQVEIRTYNSYPSDFYFNIDGVIFTGPYQGKTSQQTITYKFQKRGIGSEYYKKYFETLWDENGK